MDQTHSQLIQHIKEKTVITSYLMTNQFIDKKSQLALMNQFIITVHF